MNADSPQKKAVISFLTMVVAGKITEAYDAYVDPAMRHHNQYYKGDAATLMAGMQENHENFPDKVFSIKKILEEGDTVITYSSMKLSKTMPLIAVMHMFRFGNGKIVEMWDVAKEIATDSPNEHGAF